MAASRPIVGLRATLVNALCSSDESSEDDHLELFLMMTSSASADIQQSLRGGIGSWWVKPRSVHWINALVQSTTLFDDSRFYENFRMRRSLWWVLLDAVRGEIAKETTSLRSPVPPETALLLFLYFCAHGVNYRVLSEKFGVEHSTCHYILRRVADAICNLGLIKRPIHAEAAKITRANERRRGVPQCLLSVDGTHIPIVQPPHSGKATTIARDSTAQCSKQPLTMISSFEM